MTQELVPSVRYYIINQLGRKYQGGLMYFLDTLRPINIQYIDTRDCDISVWVSDMHKFDTQYTFKLEVYISLFGYYELWSGTSQSLVNGYTIPKQLFNLGRICPVMEIRLVCRHPTIQDNHEFMFWNINSVMRVSENNVWL
jgi:hypothetical protein